MTKIQDTKPIKQKPVGFWDTSGGGDNKASLMFPLYKKPGALRRFFVKCLLGWEWKDSNSINK